MSDIFEAIKLADDLEQFVIRTLEDWFPVYIREVELTHDVYFPQDSLPLPRAYLTSDRVEKEAADQLPAIVVVNPGLSGKPPKQEGDGSFRAFFNVGVGVFVSSFDRTETKRLVRTYTAIVRTIMLQKQSLSGFADGTTWLDESYDDNFNFVDNQTIGAGQCVFEIEVAGVVNRYGGPAAFGGPTPEPDPDTQPGALWPEVTSVIPTVEVEE